MLSQIADHLINRIEDLCLGTSQEAAGNSTALHSKRVNQHTLGTLLFLEDMAVASTRTYAADGSFTGAFDG